jgi:ABC-2 type transport system permease protein
MMRHLRLLATSLRLSVLLSMQYRWEFLMDGAMSVFWNLGAIIPLYLVFQDRAEIAGWRYGEALLVVAWFTMLDGVLRGAINPSLVSVIEHIRKGTLDFVLLKPADAQFLVSTARFMPWRVLTLIASGSIFVYAFREIGAPPALHHVLLSLVMLGAALAVLYSLWIIVISIAFRAVRIDNLRYAFEALFDVARFPSSVFRGALSFLFTFVIPLALMTTYPAQALLGTLTMERTFGGIAGAIVFAVIARFVWLRSIRTYTSAA